MPLSEHEQRLLDEMERNLYQSDGDFVAKVGGRRSRPGYRSVVLGILVVVLGIATLVTGVFIQLSIVGIVGFVLMFGGVMLAIAPGRRPRGSAEKSGGAGGSTSRTTTPGFMDRMNDRWERRQDGDH